MFALSKVSVFKIPFSLSEVIPYVSFLRDLTNDQNFFTFSFFLGQSGSVLSVSKENILEICFQYAPVAYTSSRAGSHPAGDASKYYRLLKNLFKSSCTGYQWFDCHLLGTVVSQGISLPNAENCSGFPPPLHSRRLKSRIA